MDAERELFGVVTLSEAATLWGLNRSTLMYGMNTGLLSARRSGRVWLLLSRELLAQYGQPVVKPSSEYVLRYRSTRRKAFE